MNKISDSIIDKIQEEKIQPIPHWVFACRNTCLWLLSIVTTATGAFAINIMLFAYTSSTFDMFDHASHTPQEHILSLLPYFWLTVGSVATICAITSLRKTDRGYRVGITHACIISLTLSLLMGLAIHVSGTTEQFLKVGQEIQTCTMHGCKCKGSCPK